MIPDTYSMRFFIALEIPENSKQELANLQSSIKKIIPQIHLSDIDKLHLTIAFVGEEPDSLRKPLVEVVSKAASGIKPFPVSPAYIDGFPTLHHARVLWIGVKGEIDKLHIIRHKVKDGLEHLQLDTDERKSYTSLFTLTARSRSFCELSFAVIKW